MDPLTAPARSWLFVPADRPDRYAKAAASGADRVIIDLEDAVPPGRKSEARRILAAATLPTEVPVYVRVNGAATEWFEDDVRAVARLRLAGVVLPKARTHDDISHVGNLLPAAERVVPMIETALGVWNVLEIARSPHVERLAFGAVDLELDTGIRDEGDACANIRAELALASRIAGIQPPIDTVTIGIDDAATLGHDAARSQRFGFAGKLCIHPRQLAAIHAAFRPSAEEAEWARLVVEAVAARGDEAPFALRGTMVDYPVIERARRIDALARAGG